MLPDGQRPGISELQRRCVDTRLGVLDEMDVAGSGHLGPAFSVVEILVTLYYSYLSVRPDEPRWPGRDRFILSKGHACSALYPILADLGFFEREHLATFTRLGSILGDHPDMRKIPGIDFSSGSLGHGLSIGAGMAEALRLARAHSKVVVLMGDGELNEGQVWEAAAYAAHRKLSRLLGIVDVNAVCVDGSTTEVLEFEPLEKKWAAFGWRVQRLPGHDIGALLEALDGFNRYLEAGGELPTVLIADTVAGRGISFIEGMAEWHVGYLASLDRARAVHDIETMFETREAVSV
jgi:transketolase